MKLHVCVAMMAFVAMACGSAQATLLVQEGFDYPLGQVDNTQTGGVGFASGSYWTPVAAAAWVTNGLSFSGLASSGPAALRAKSSGGSRHTRALASGIGGSTFYMSLLINANGAATDRFGVELRPNDGPLFGRVAGGWGMFAGYNGALGISNSEGAYKTWTGVSNVADSVTHLFVVKVDYAANAIKIYVDPLPDGTEPLPSATLATGGSWTVNLNSGTWSAVGLWMNPANMAADELRIGTTWADVVPATVISAAVQEGFDYAAGGLDGSQSNGLGFAAASHWGANAGTGGIDAGLTYSNFVTSGGGAFKTVGYYGNERAVASLYGGSKFYISQLINARGHEVARCGLEVRNGDGPLFGRVTGGWGMFAGRAGGMGISNSDGDFKVWTGVSNAADSATHLIVVKVDYAANAVKLFVDPVVSGAEPAPSATLVTGGKWTVNLDSDVWSGVRLFHETSDMLVDELRIGKTWGSVVPVQRCVWTQTAGGSYRWVTRANWEGGSVADSVPGGTVDFGTVDLAGDVTLALDATRTAALWKFGDAAGAQNWTVNAGGAGAALELAGTLPAIQVDQNTATVHAPVTGTNGLVKAGAGTLVLDGANTYSGQTAVSAGTLRLAASDALPAGSGIALSGGTLELAAACTNSAGALEVAADSTLELGNGTGRLTFTGDSTVCAWTGRLTLTGTLDRREPTALRFFPCRLTSAQLRRISYDGAGVHLDAAGYLLPGAQGTLVRIL